jgi:hypothetical protein
MTARMRTEDECLAMTAEMDRQADRCAGCPVQASYLGMAETWRWVAQQATWQDSPKWRRFYAD